MATLQIPPSNQILPGSCQLPNITFPAPVLESALPADPKVILDKWAASFTSLVQSDRTDVSSLFVEDSYWRDLLCLTWNFHTLAGIKKIESFIGSLPKRWRIRAFNTDSSDDFRAPQVAPLDFPGTIKCIQSFLTIETDVGRGRGLVRLLQDDKGNWKCYTLLTVLEELSGFEELNGTRRPHGVDYVARSGRKNWQDLRASEQKLEDEEPSVLIIGSGQAGLTVSARLKQLAVSSLIVDLQSKVGDNWRKRYHHLVLHDSVWFDHMPYLNFPSNWPIFSPKDKLADWFDSYAKILELNIWANTKVVNAKWDDTKGLWTVDVERELEGGRKSRTLHPRHIVLATGASGRPSLPDIPGMSTFSGSRLLHSSEFHGLPSDATDDDGQGKNVVVVGSSNSGHDIAQDYYEHGYDVTMVQRGSTHVVRSKTLVDVTMSGLYCEGGPPVEDADIINHSFPWPVLKRFQVDATNECARRDADLLSGLQAAGFRLDSGPDAAGLWTKYLSRGGGYYIDTGCSDLIANGSIKIKSCSDIERIDGRRVLFPDCSELEADELVFATGYSTMQDTAAEIVGPEIAAAAGPVWGFDAEGETRGVWRRSGHRGFWYMGGNLALCRFYSRTVALGIKGLEEGLYKWNDP